MKKKIFKYKILNKNIKKIWNIWKKKKRSKKFKLKILNNFKIIGGKFNT
jgi:hypothetical protein